MGKLTEVYDKGRHNVTASQARGTIKDLWQEKASAFWHLAKKEMRRSFTIRNSVAALAVLALTTVGIYAVSDKIAATEAVYRVYIDGKYLGIVRDKTVIDSQLQVLGSKVKATVTVQPVHEVVQASSEMAVAEAIDDSTKVMTPMVAIRVNGRDVVYVKDQATADKLINQLKAKYATGSNTTVALVDQVDFVPLQDDKSKITDVNAAFALIEEGTQEQKKYVVSRGDSLWDIASKNHISVDQLHQANPQIEDLDAIAEGQQINLNTTEPLINVQTVSQESRLIKTNYEIENRDDDSLYKGQQKVIQEGETGTTKQTVRIIRKNGLVEKEDVISSQIVTPPKKEIVAKGTKQPDAGYSGDDSGAAASDGSWGWPIAGGYISSYYGEIREGESRPHPGTDIAAPTGTAIYASNDGVVVQAADIGDGYGNCVRIQHANGVMSIYGHMSSISVSVGQHVSRGERLGGVGMTGWATGPHLHYEVHVNGVRVNPAPYM